MKAGFCYVVYGTPARREAADSIKTLRRFNRQPVTVVGDSPLDGTSFVEFEGRGLPGRWAKVNLDLLSPYEFTCYLDADTRVHADLSVGFEMLKDGWTLVIAPSVNQGERWLHHIQGRERQATLDELGFAALQMQAGMFFFRKGRAAAALFGAWREEWARWELHDQGALLRALRRSPVKIWLLGQPYSNGPVVRHLFGRLR